jgi:antitoxin (DNA-binding transcriptional repressor) of toxin-antitoxin stability system
MNTRISATDLARGLADVLNRVRYRSEHFTIDRNGEPIAQIAPMKPATVITMTMTMGEFVRQLADLPAPDRGYADELEQIQAAQPPAGHTPWAS